MFDVLVYLYETYWRPDACPDHAQLTRKLTAVGFENDEIQEALNWLDGLAAAGSSYQGEQSDHAMRGYAATEVEHLGEASIGFISFLESAGVLPGPMREMVIDRAMAQYLEGIRFRNGTIRWSYLNSLGLKSAP